MFRLSVVIPTYNRAYCLDNAIRSCLAHGRVQVVIIDDGSSDSTHQLLDQYNSNGNVVIHKNDKNMGQNYCRNLGYSLSTSDAVLIIDSDDLLLGDYLDDILLAIENDPLSSAVYFLPTQRMSDNRYPSHASFMLTMNDYVRNKLVGEYAAIIKKSRLRLNVSSFWEAVPGCRRSCSDLTWLKILKTHSVCILNYPVRHYCDTGTDRMSSRSFMPLNRYKDLILCSYFIIYKEFWVLLTKPIYLSKRLAKLAAYAIIYSLMLPFASLLCVIFQ